MARLGEHPRYREILEASRPFMIRNVDRLASEQATIGDEGEHYTFEVARRMMQIVSCSEQLHMFLFFLTNYSAPKKFMSNGISHSDYLIYHTEGYFIRLGSLLDRTYSLVNEVLELGLPDHKQELVKDMKQTKRSRLGKSLKTLKAAIEPVKRARNLVAHQQSYVDRELLMLQMFELDVEMAEFGPMMKRVYVWGRRMEYGERIEDLEGILSSVFEEVFVEWQARRDKK